MRISGEWFFADHTQAVCAMLTDAGHQALFVGGCVRNALLGAPVNDIDIATDARPERVMDLAAAAGLKPVPTGFDHGTITVVAGGLPHEVTTFRRDVETFGRHAVVAFADTAQEDAHRRDFTMNALYATPDGTVIDPLGGLPDLIARRVRFIDDADARIREDYLRILRFFRFHAWYGDPAGGLDADGLAACASNADGLKNLSRERVGAELKKLLSAPDPGQSVAAMEASGLLARALPGAAAKALPVLVHLETGWGIAPDPIRRLAALGGQDHADRLRLSKAEARKLDHLRAAIGSADSPAVLGYRLGVDQALDAVLLRAALLETPLLADARDAIARGAAAEFPVRPRDLMPALSGPALGARLKELEARWIASGFALTRDDLLGDGGGA
ncbi:CCA tRNA nucleotidyltransferase [Rhodovulum adriaticum]|uniref:Poly(A) polymerase n=1 Tax=Rhodovulum adriaticum TaxID=35804 RepID=A0A4R2P1I0_RHOAD|nr:CCA tRNA nucleotidyltransferase [Rhodovulum adriaticum]MBK1636132.1 CCA tRNA nucleotidyltransferase [Rhodovulum adriaticum]TCP27515.1 poly(A) polymerase [Rhodovulum adriaticum]